MIRHALLLASLFSGVSAHAQQTVDPGRVSERLREAPQAPDVAGVEIPTLPSQQAMPDSNVTIRLAVVRFEGATVVPVDVLDELARPYLDRDIPLAELFGLAEKVTAEYRRRGYVLSRAIVGPQRIEGGVATIQIIEGFVDRVRIEENAGGYRPYLESYFSPVGRARPTTAAALSRALLLARDLQGANVRAILQPSAAVEGAADLSLVVESKPIEAFFAIDNRGSRWLGPLQVFGGISLNDPLGTGGRLTLAGVAAPDEKGELGFVSGTYEQPLGGSGLRANAFASYAHTRPGDELRILELDGESFSWGLGLQYPFLRSRSANVIGRLNWIARDSNSRNFLLDPVFDDKIRAISAELQANHADRMGGQITARLGVTRGLSVFGATEAADSAKSRATASGSFTRINGEITRTQPVHGGLQLLLAATGQWTRDSLLASEEFGIGGSEYGRAYDPSEITGDKGFAAKAELFYPIRAAGMGSVEPFAYFEGGRVYQNHPLPGEAKRSQLRSVGGGVRVGIARRFGLSMEYAKPIGRDVNALGDRDGRIFLSFSAAY